jgi:hypothetical protein
MRGESGRGREKIKESKRGEARNERDKVRSERGGGGKAKKNNDNPITTVTRDKRKKRSREDVIRKIKIKRIKVITETGEGKISELCSV